MTACSDSDQQSLTPLLVGVKVSGTMKITEICLGSEEEDYIVTVASDKDDEKYKCLVEAIRELQPLVVKLLLQFDNEIKGLQQ